jgi:iron transport multicopper oxidase
MLNSILVLLFSRALSVVASTVSLNWDIDWVSVAPDGIVRPAVGVNGQWPCPPIEVNIGDRVLLQVNNKLGNETTAIHFHGIFQTGSTQME